MRFQARAINLRFAFQEVVLKGRLYIQGIVYVVLIVTMYLYTDIAVGAPYQDMPSDNNAQGAVYIYYGNKDTVISRTPDQVGATCSWETSILGPHKLCFFTHYSFFNS